MAKFVFRDIKIYYGGRDLSGELSSLSLEFGADTPDSTVLSDTTRRRLPGLLSVSSTHNGWWDSVSATDSVDLDLFSQVGASPLLISAATNAGAKDEISYSWQALTAEYSPGATVGEVFSYTFNTTGDGRLIRGTVLANATLTTTGDSGTKPNIGAAASTDTIYSMVHVYAVSGTSPTLDVVLNSDADASAGGETARITHAQITDVSARSEVLTLVGPVTDAFYEHTFTIGGGTPSFSIFSAVAVLPSVPPV